ncbi:MAG: helix-turn-helix transcriptional regulator [Deltaproteobacteria bacterium]|jgi:AraC-like DNA-binding protein|nr:helix-turn-helix transcriptional regulator [Deltaproteobacteria bacterium]MBK8714737.1 helix-turn-helix transcriptional regulator [Deltaproteobacteria bacterium]
MLIPPPTFAKLCRARRLLVDPDARALPLRELAAAVGLSHHQMIRQFAALFGDTPHQLRIAARVELARELLARGDRSVTEVCFELGLSSLGSFSAGFARRTGTSPSRARRGFVSVPPPLPIPGCFGLMCVAR